MGRLAQDSLQSRIGDPYRSISKWPSWEASWSGLHSDTKFHSNSYHCAAPAPSWAVLGARLGRFGASWRPLAVLELSGALWELSWGRLGALLGCFGTLLGVLEPSWIALGPLGEPPGPSWDDLWSLLGCFGQFLVSKGENPKTFPEP